MSFIDNVKDVVSVVQKADNVDLYRQLLDIYKEALEMQGEIGRLKEENKDLRNNRDIESRIVRNQKNEWIMPHFTLRDDEQHIKYCATCWGLSSKLVQMSERGECIACSLHTRGHNG